MTHLKERINRNGIRHDFLYIMLDIPQTLFSMYINGKRTMPKEVEEELNEYLTEIEKINKKYIVI